MGRFFNKSELIVIMMIILLFDLNGFCAISSAHITYKDQRAWFGVMLAMSFLLFDIYIYRSLVNSTPVPDVSYRNNKKHKLDCEGIIDDQISNYNEQINIMKKSCTVDTKNEGETISEQLVMLFINVVIIVIILSCIFFGGNNEKSNTMNMRILLSIPFVILSCSVSACAIFW